MTENVFKVSKEDLEFMQNEVEEINKKIIELCKSDSELANLYKGAQIYYSPAVENTDLMFIGINPGNGAYKKNGGKYFASYTPLEKSEYVTEEYNLQNDWRYVFGEKEKINNIELLFNSFKTNCCFWATDNSTSLRKLRGKLYQYFGSEINRKENSWIQTIIGYIKPKIIICEGFGAYNELLHILKSHKIVIDDFEAKFKNHKVAYLDGMIKIIGFKRNISSRFVDIEDVVDTLYDFLKNSEIISGK